MRMNRRQFVRSFGAASLAAGAAPFVAPWSGASRDTRSSRGNGGTLEVWLVDSHNPAADKFYGEQMVAWGQKNGYNVKYSIQPGSNYEQKLAAAVQANALPDVVRMLGDDDIYYGSQGHLVDLSDLLAELKTLGGGMYPGLVRSVEIGKKAYSIPMETSATVLYTRLDMCEKATGQRQPPKTLDEMESIARKVNDPANNFYGLGFTLRLTLDASWISAIMTADGGYWVNKKGEPAVNNSGTISALERAQRWWKDKLIPPSAPSGDDSWNNQLYEAGQVAFVYNPATIYVFLAENSPDLLHNTQQAPVPMGRAKKSFQGISSQEWSIAKSSPHVGAAKAMLRAIMQPNSAEQMYEQVGGGFYPVYKDLANRPFWQQRTEFAEFPKIIQNALPDWYPATKPTAKLISQLSAINDQYLPGSMLEDVCLRGTSPKQAAKNAQQKMEQIFEQTTA